MITKRLHIGDTVIADLSNQNSSFYRKAKGTVKSIDTTGWVTIIATEVIDKWSKSNEFEKHPTQCAISVKLEDIEHA